MNTRLTRSAGSIPGGDPELTWETNQAFERFIDTAEELDPKLGSFFVVPPSGFEHRFPSFTGEPNRFDHSGRGSRVQLGAHGLPGDVIIGVGERFTSAVLDLRGPRRLAIGVGFAIETGEQIGGQLGALGDAAPGDLLWIACSKTPAGKRTLEVPEDLRFHLVACCAGKESSRYIFEAEDGKPHWRDWIRKNVHRICDKAKVPHVTAHSMRGLLATITAERGLAPHLIAATLGHAGERITMQAYAAPGSATTGVNRRG